MQLVNKLFKNRDNSVIKKMIMAILPMQILSIISLNLANLADNILIANLLETNYFVIFALLNPINFIYLSIATIVSFGAIGLCSKALIKSKREELSKIMFHAVILVIVIAIALAIINFVFSDEIVMLLGGSSLARKYIAISAFDINEYILHASRYIKGLSYGLVFTMLIPVSVMFLKFGNDSKAAIISSLVMLGCKIGFDLIGIYNFNDHMYGLGIATSISSFITMGFIVTRFLLDKGLVRPKLVKIDFKIIKNIFKLGLFKELGNLCLMVFYIFLNNIAIYSLGMEALLPISVILSIGLISGNAIINAGGDLIELLSIHLIKEEDKKSLINLLKYTISIVGILNVIVCVLMIIFNKGILGLFNISNNEFASGLFIHYVISFVIGLIPYYWISIQKALNRNKLAYLYTLGLNLIVKVVVVFIFTLLFKSSGLYYGFWLVDLLGIIVIPLISIKLKKTPLRSIDEVLDLPSDFGISDENRLELDIDKYEDALDVSKKISEFVKLNDDIEYNRKVYYASLALEEVANNYLDNSKNLKNKELVLRVSIKNNKLILCIKDNYTHLNPLKKYQHSDYNMDYKNIGIKVVMDKANEIIYNSSYKANIVTIIF